MDLLTATIEDLVAANHILEQQRVVDTFGHISVRHPTKPDRFLLSRARAPDLVESSDILEFALNGDPIDASGPKPYLERFIHAALYAARPDVNSVVHSHSRTVIPFSISEVKLRPVAHICATIGEEVPVWDSHDNFGDTGMLIGNLDTGRDFARLFGNASSVLMRGHGSTVVGDSIKEAVFTAIHLEVNAELQLKALQLGAVKYLTRGEVEQVAARFRAGKSGEGFDRAWEYWCRQAGATGNTPLG
jgi:ribulose-5-phosphate 4-epimerase/fuculose-1-phosphate aldolase